jgi:DNA-binding MarR family transcriptional regulator
VLDNIRRIVRLLRLGSREAERRVGLTGAQLFVLEKLAEAKTLSVNELAERTHTHQSSVSVVAQALVDKGLIARARAADDARRLELSLTPQARALLRKAPDAAQDHLIEAIGRMPSNLRSQLARGLARLCEEAGIAGEEAQMLFADEPTPSKGSKSRSRSSGRRATSPRAIDRSGRFR